VSTSEHQQILGFFLGVGLLLFGYGFMYRRTRLDCLREDLFTIRDSLFDYMWQHSLSYDDRAYQYLRYMLNGAIRYAVELRPFTILAFWLLVHPNGREFNDILQKEDLDPEVKTYFSGVRRRVGRRLLQYVFLEGPECLLYGPIQILFRYSGRHRTAVRDAWTEELAVLGRPRSPAARLLRLRIH